MPVTKEADEFGQLKAELIERGLFVKGAPNGIKCSPVVNGTELQVGEALHEDMLQIVEVLFQVLAGNELGLSEPGLGDKKLMLRRDIFLPLPCDGGRIKENTREHVRLDIGAHHLAVRGRYLVGLLYEG
tara:strand:+ start:1131 stop:1517 length:387 start_codon:yes stop_codon:yes gene_type:complete